jgi:exonuclease VII small subunit
MSWIWKTIIIAAVILFIVFGVYKLWVQNNNLEADIEKLSASLTDIESENRDLEYKIDYFENPNNLLKELKSQFNYREVGEEIIIVVPGNNGESD